MEIQSANAWQCLFFPKLFMQLGLLLFWLTDRRTTDLTEVLTHN